MPRGLPSLRHALPATPNTVPRRVTVQDAPTLARRRHLQRQAPARLLAPPQAQGELASRPLPASALWQAPHNAAASSFRFALQIVSLPPRLFNMLCIPQSEWAML